MRLFYCILASVLALWVTSCSDEKESFPASDLPRITVVRDALYSVPDRNFLIKARLEDDLGLKSLNISIPEFFLDKTIRFDVGERVKNYDLSYEFLAPATTKDDEQYKVTLTLTDLSGNIISKVLTLHLDGDFDAPQIIGLKPVDGAVFLMSDEPTVDLNVTFDLEDVTGIQSVEVFQEELGIDEKLSLDGVKSYHFDKTYQIPSKVAAYELQVKVTDTFVEPNVDSVKVTFSMAEGLTTMYLADVPLGTDLEKYDAVGVPMYYHEVQDGVFMFKYYANRDNKEIYFLGQESSFEPHCFGFASNGVLDKSTTAAPVVLPSKGYYEITVDPVKMTYEAKPYTPNSPVYTADMGDNRIVVVGWGMTPETSDQSWSADTSHTGALVLNDPDNPYILTKEVVLVGYSDLQIVISRAGWSTFWRMDKNGVVVLNGGTEHWYKGRVGTYVLRMDTELERISLIKK